MYKYCCYSKDGNWVNANIANQKGDYKTYNYADEVINDAKAASNIKDKAFEHYSRLVNADRTDSISLVKDKCYQNDKNSDKNSQKVLEWSWKAKEDRDCDDKIVIWITNLIKRNYFMNEVK
ncbi:26568_t:CDS:2, partial [Racocetra persica]